MIKGNMYDENLIPKVNIVIPAYNRKKSLREAINSILMQDYVNLEIIVSDNASDDGTEEMMRKWIEQEPKIKYYRNEKNLGIGENYRKICCEYPDGKYVALLDSDDYYIDKNYISSAVSLLESHEKCSCVAGGVCVINQKRGDMIFDMARFYLPKYMQRANLFEQCLMSPYHDVIPVTQTLVFKRKYVDNVCKKMLGEVEGVMIPWFLLWFLALMGDVCFIHNFVSGYRIWENNNSTQGKTTIYDANKILANYKEFYLKFCSHNRKMSDTAAKWSAFISYRIYSDIGYMCDSSALDSFSKLYPQNLKRVFFRWYENGRVGMHLFNPKSRNEYKNRFYRNKGYSCYLSSIEEEHK